MIKSILKEICVMILLCVAIVLVLGVVFYEYIPSNKIVPNKLEAYKTPENIQGEIEEQDLETNKIEVTYEITAADLNLYKQTHSYTTGKPDPFATSSIISTNNSIKDKENTNSETNSNGDNSTSTNNYFPGRKGLK